MGRNPSERTQHGTSLIGNDLPVQKVSWMNAVKFANALSRKEGLREAYRISGSRVTWDETANGYRLPTEAEWEFAARAGAENLFSGAANENELCRMGNVADAGARRRQRSWVASSCDDGHFGPAPVGSYRPNGLGLYDMSGNVFEWCWDIYGSSLSNATDPTGARSGANRVFRGGSWHRPPHRSRVAARGWGQASAAGWYYVGLRLARTVR
jgi:formylglycine-generating enzyme required for sulfatase activity